MESNQKQRGYIHLYTGNGKGKTTAALGLALRAIGAGQQVFIAQFVKGMPYSEILSIKKYLPGITLLQYGLDCFIVNEPTDKDIEAARKGLLEVSEIIASNLYDMVILDEICIALYYKLFSLNEVIDLLKSKPEPTELVLTGRYAPAQLIEIADLVTEMKEIKHYYNQGIEARKGIEF
ncbi:MAG: cob(I)yrinic acid a,c-diamide adenosyltransferase [Tenuifilaceae bacterium]